MVYFKRKTVQIPPPTYTPSDEDTPCWVIPATMEYFVSYDDYLKRMDFYNQKKFICELSGHSCLTFLQALDKETHESQNVINSFPESLREPILRNVQFSQISRLDQLVDTVYNALRYEFFPGEYVHTRMRDAKLKCVIRDKVSFPAPTPTGELQQIVQYRVELASDPTRIIDIAPADITRDRRNFSKLTIRTFIKHAASRENWAGAPWVVRKEYTDQYRLPTDPPPYIKAVIAAREEMSAQAAAAARTPSGPKTAASATRASGSPAPPRILVPIAPAQAAGRSAAPASGGGGGHDSKRRRGNRSMGPAVDDLTAMVERLALSSLNSRLDHTSINGSANGTTDDHAISKRPGDIVSQCKTSTGEPWPVWKTSDIEDPVLSQLLEVWSFLNVYNELLGLEPVPFDALVAALQGDGQDILLDEVHAALMTLFVDEGEEELALSLPVEEIEQTSRKKHRRLSSDQEAQAAQNSHDSDNADGEDSPKHGDDDFSESPKSDQVDTSMNDAGDDNKNGTNGSGPKPAKDSESSDEAEPRDDQDENQEDREDQEENQENQEDESESEEEPADHLADDFLELKRMSWMERIGRRQFSNGGWQQVLICILYSVDYMSEWKETIAESLRQLAPLGRRASLGAAVKGYGELEFKLRVAALYMICRILYSSHTIRHYMDQRVDEAAKVRKDRTERTREIKNLTDRARTLREQQAALLAAADGETAESLRQTSSDFADAEKQEAEIQTELTALNQSNRGVSAELARLDVHRIQLLGKDRFYNRYWWMEAAGMDAPSDDPSEEDKPEFLMGRLWVQGPTEQEYAAYLSNEDFNQDLTGIVQSVVANAKLVELGEVRAAAERNLATKRAYMQSKVLRSEALAREREQRLRMEQSIADQAALQAARLSEARHSFDESKSARLADIARNDLESRRNAAVKAVADATEQHNQEAARLVIGEQTKKAFADHGHVQTSQPHTPQPPQFQPVVQPPQPGQPMQLPPGHMQMPQMYPPMGQMPQMGQPGMMPQMGQPGMMYQPGMPMNQPVPYPGYQFVMTQFGLMQVPINGQMQMMMPGMPPQGMMPPHMQMQPGMPMMQPGMPPMMPMPQGMPQGMPQPMPPQGIPQGMPPYYGQPMQPPVMQLPPQSQQGTPGPSPLVSRMGSVQPHDTSAQDVSMADASVVEAPAAQPEPQAPQTSQAPQAPATQEPVAAAPESAEPKEAAPEAATTEPVAAVENGADAANGTAEEAPVKQEPLEAQDPQPQESAQPEAREVKAEAKPERSLLDPAERDAFASVAAATADVEAAEAALFSIGTVDKDETTASAFSANVPTVDIVELKRATEGDSVMLKAGEWRFYDSEDAVKQLERYLWRGGRREARLAEELARIGQYIRGGIAARTAWLENEPEWTNELAIKSLGSTHCRRRR